MTNEEMLLTAVFDCGLADLDRLYRLIEDYLSLDGNVEDVIENARDEIGGITFGSVAYSAMELTMNKILSLMEESVEEYVEEDKKDKYLEKIEELRDDFNPWINFLDTEYNNFLDDIEIPTLPDYADEEYIQLLDDLMKNNVKE